MTNGVRRILVPAVGLLAAATVLALGSGLADERQPAAMNALPYLIALAAGLLIAPARLERFEPRALPRLLWVPALTAVVTTLLAARIPDDPRWAHMENLHAELLYAVHGLSLGALFLVACLGAIASLPLLVIRRVSCQLEWQALAAFCGGLACVLALGGDVILSERPQNLLLVLGFPVLGAASFLVDHWTPPKGASLERDPLPGVLGRPLRASGACLGLALVLPLLFQPVAGFVLSPSLGEPAPEVEEILNACADLLAKHRREENQFPASLTELKGVDWGIASGVKHDYVFRYGAQGEGFTLAADPQREEGSWAHYRIAEDGVLETGPKPLPLFFENPW